MQNNVRFEVIMVVRMTMLFFRVLMPSPSSAQKMETVCFSKMLVSTYESKWRQNPEQQYCYAKQAL
jgi:hypothetical protein